MFTSGLIIGDPLTFHLASSLGQNVTCPILWFMTKYPSVYFVLRAIRKMLACQHTKKGWRT